MKLVWTNNHTIAIFIIFLEIHPFHFWKCVSWSTMENNTFSSQENKGGVSDAQAHPDAQMHKMSTDRPSRDERQEEIFQITPLPRDASPR
jgi:hypothetical protein